MGAVHVRSILCGLRRMKALRAGGRALCKAGGRHREQRDSCGSDQNNSVGLLHFSSLQVELALGPGRKIEKELRQLTNRKELVGKLSSGVRLACASRMPS